MSRGRRRRTRILRWPVRVASGGNYHVNRTKNETNLFK